MWHLYINKTVLSYWSSNFKCIFNILHLCSPLLTISGFDMIFVCGWFSIFTVCLPLLVSLSVCGFLVSSCGLFFSTQRISFGICCKAGLMVLSCLSFCLFVKLLFFQSNLNENLSGQSILGCRIFLFIALNILHYSFLAYRVSAEKSGYNLTGIPLHVICDFSSVSFNIFLLVFYFCQFDFYVSQRIPPWVYVSAGDPTILACMSDSVSYEVTAFFPLGLVHPPREEFLFPSVLWNSCNHILLPFKTRFFGVSSPNAISLD